MDKLQYKGYTCLLSHSKNSERLCGVIYAPGKTDVPIDDVQIAGKDISEINDRFVSKTESLIRHAEFQSNLERWKSEIDYLSVAAVMNILPDVFERRIKNGEFDNSLLQGVVGYDYVVPLYYVTKAWDVLLKGSLGACAFFIGPDEEDDFCEEVLQEFMRDESASRTRAQAIEDNDKMKALWKKYFDIDIDALVVDFKQFDIHLPPNVSEDEYDRYFRDVPDGINEWIMWSINHPNESMATHDSVSSLMEFTAEILIMERCL